MDTILRTGSDDRDSYAVACEPGTYHVRRQMIAGSDTANLHIVASNPLSYRLGVSLFALQCPRQAKKLDMSEMYFSRMLLSSIEGIDGSESPGSISEIIAR